MFAATLGINNKTANRIFMAGRALLTAAFAILFVAALYPDARSSMRSALSKDFRIVSSTAHGDLLGSGEELTVAKVRTRDALFLEIYEPMKDGSQHLLERIELPDKRDGYFNFNGEATSLAIDDIDGDGRKEIIVPSFDQNLVGHLNIYRYDQGSGVFQRSLR